MSLHGACVEGAIFSVLSLPSKGHVWDCISQVESAHVHSDGDTLGPHPLHNWCCIAQDTVDCWLHPMGCGSLFAAAVSRQWLENIWRWVVTQDLCCSIS